MNEMGATTDLTAPDLLLCHYACDVFLFSRDDTTLHEEKPPKKEAEAPVRWASERARRICPELIHIKTLG